MAESRLEVVLLGCGTPKFSMGWTHLFQMLNEPLRSMAEVVGIVEPFFLSERGKTAKGGDLFHAWLAEHSSIPCVDAVGKLPPVRAGRLRVGVVAVRTADAARMAREAVLDGGCHALYLEKPGAASLSELEELQRLTEERGVTVAMGYSRNLGYPRRGLAFAKEQRAAAGRSPGVTLVHSNPWEEEELGVCFERCQPGMLYDMACHDLAVAVSYLGLTADYEALDVDASRSLRASHGGIEDFVRLAFTITPKNGADPVSFRIDRCTGAFNGMEVEVLEPTSKGDDVSGAKRLKAEPRRFMSGDKPLLFENPLQDLSPHLAVQYDYYVEAKRIFFEALLAAARAGLPGQAPLPYGLPTLGVAREVMLLAEGLTAELKSRVPCA